MMDDSASLNLPGERAEIKTDIAGVNHFTFVTAAQWNGIDLFAQRIALASGMHHP